jgi:hypothetical protein
MSAITELFGFNGSSRMRMMVYELTVCMVAPSVSVKLSIPLGSGGRDVAASRTLG